LLHPSVAIHVLTDVSDLSDIPFPQRQNKKAQLNILIALKGKLIFQGLMMGTQTSFPPTLAYLPCLYPILLLFTHSKKIVGKGADPQPPPKIISFVFELDTTSDFKKKGKKTLDREVKTTYFLNL
jgi:hypothetical protein